MNIWYKLTLSCGLTPLIAGSVIFIAWLSTREDWLVLAGMYNLMLGLALFTCGLIFLFTYGQKELKDGRAYPIKRSLISLGILLFNFPAAALALYSADYIVNTSTATVVNNSPFEITDLILSEKNLGYPFPPIASGQEVTEKFHFKYEGAVNYKLSLNGAAKEGVMFGYVTGAMGENATMVISRNGAVEIRR